jgi:hypothetical protein
MQEFPDWFDLIAFGVLLVLGSIWTLSNFAADRRRGSSSK